jgi:hypothetical protein
MLLLPITRILLAPALLLAEDALQQYGLDRVQIENSVLGAFRGWYDAPDRAALKALGNKAETDPNALDKDPNVTLRRRLQSFLGATADVDFAASIQGEGSSRRFVDQQSEARPPEWKMCFRAGQGSDGRGARLRAGLARGVERGEVAGRARARADGARRGTCAGRCAFRPPAA